MESQLELAEKAGSLAREILEIEGLLKRNHDVILQLQRKAALFRDQKFDAERRFAETMDRLVSLSSRDLDVEMPPAFVPPGMQKSAEAQEESLTGNSLDRVFEEHPPLPEDIAKAEVSIARERAAEACVAGFEQCARNVRSQQDVASRDYVKGPGAEAMKPVGPVAGALHPFRELQSGELIPMWMPPPYSNHKFANAVLAQRRNEFDAWLKQHDLELIHGNRDWYLRSVSGDEARLGWDWIVQDRSRGLTGPAAFENAVCELLRRRKPL